MAEKKTTFTRHNLLAEALRQLAGVRFATPDDRLAVTEHTTGLAVSQAVLVSAPDLTSVPQVLRRPDGTSRFRAPGQRILRLLR